MHDPIIDSRAMFALSRLLTERNAAFLALEAVRAEAERAKRALLAGGYTDLGGQDWKPPLGPIAAPLLDELDAARADMREAMELLRAHGEPPDWMQRKPGHHSWQWHHWHRRYGGLLARHKETKQ